MDQQPLDLYEPSSRFAHVSCSSDGQVIVWGGRTFAEFYGSIQDKLNLASVVQQFDPSAELWRQHKTRGPPHPGLSGAACTSSGNYLYFYGGHSRERYSGVLSCLDVKTLTWSLLCPETAGGPMKKLNCGMVLYNKSKLAVIGGFGCPTGPTQPGSTFIRSTRFTDGRGCSNEFHVFDIIQGLWSSPTLRGTRPPPCAWFTLTSIDSLHAVLFGGSQPGRGCVSDLYLIDFNTMEITKVEPGEGEPWPSERGFHAACCLGYAGDNIHLLITGGCGRDGKPLNDMWLFDLSLKKWKEVTLSDGILPRQWHSATAIILCPGLVEVIVFGGTSDDSVYGKPFQSYSRLAETTIFSFGQFGSEWVLMGVATNKLRGTSERVRDKMILQSGEAPPFDRESLVTTYALYRLERGGIPVWREINNKNRDFQAVLRQKQPDANLAMIKWLNREQKANIKPTWKNVFLVLCLINLDHLAEKIETFMTGSEESTVSKLGELDSVLTMASLTQLETAAGIPVLSELEAKNHEFQAIIRVKQHNVSGAINKWLTAPVLSRIVPTWNNFLSVLCLIHLDNVAQRIRLYLSKHLPSTLESEGDQGGEIAAHRREIFVLRQQVSDRDETISEQKEQIEAIMKHSRLSTATWKESTTKFEHPSIGPVPSPMPARPKPHLFPLKTKRREEAMSMMALGEPSMVGHPSSSLEQKPTHIKTKHFTTADTLSVESQEIQSPQALVQTGELSAPPPPDSGELKPTPTAAGFRGVEVCAETTVVITNSPQTFVWQGYGLKLNIPKGCLPAGMDEATIYIQASLSGQYEFPENTHLVSAVFWLRCKPSCRFTVPVSMEIQHCARLENINKLSFVKASCSQESLPYTFRQLTGRFTSSCSYGVLELDSFSGAAVTQEGSEDREYIARLFYLNQTISTYDIHLVVTWNTEAHLTDVKREYHQERQALAGPVQPVDFESDQIKVDIPLDGIALKEGWIITPLTAPVVMKRNVDNYQRGQWIPSCEFELRSTDSKPVPLLHRVKLLGAKEPHNMFTIRPPMAGAGYGTHHSATGQSSSSSSSSKRSSEVDQSEGPSLKKSRTMDSQPQTGPSPKVMDISSLTRTSSSSHGKDTAEYQTIRGCTPDLKTAVESHLTNLSGHLLAKHLISSDQDVELRNRTVSKCDRAASLVQFVRDKVEQNSDNYHSLINILTEMDKTIFQDILKRLNDTYISFAGDDH